MRLIPQDRLERTALAIIGCLTLLTLGLAAPAVAKRLQPEAQVRTTPTPTAPPAAVLLPEELQKALQGVVIIANDQSFGMAFAIDGQGNLLTAAHLVTGSQALRLIDNTGGSHVVTVVGVDTRLDLAQVRAASGATPLPFADLTTVHPGDPGALLASPKNAVLATSTPVVITALHSELLEITAEFWPENAGGPIAGYGGKVIGMATSAGPGKTALPIDAALADLAAWRSSTGTVMPLAPIPPTLRLRGSELTIKPSRTVTFESIQPSQASTSRDTALTIKGSGFVPGSGTRLRFIPTANQTGAFDLVAALANSTTITAKLPGGHPVQDYRVQLIDGDGASVTLAGTFTISP
jgi:hypothetical protein